MTAGEVFPVPPWSRLERLGLRTTELPVHKTGRRMRPTSLLPDTGKRRTVEWRTRKPIYSRAVANLEVIHSPFHPWPRSVEWRTHRGRR